RRGRSSADHLPTALTAAAAAGDEAMTTYVVVELEAFAEFRTLDMHESLEIQCLLHTMSKQLKSTIAPKHCKARKTIQVVRGAFLGICFSLYFFMHCKFPSECPSIK
ncbi:hypothetical protein SDRG_10404, partial [Saprolegnia diclina VS20]